MRRLLKKTGRVFTHLSCRVELRERERVRKVFASGVTLGGGATLVLGLVGGSASIFASMGSMLLRGSMVVWGLIQLYLSPKRMRCLQFSLLAVTCLAGASLFLPAMADHSNRQSEGSVATLFVDVQRSLTLTANTCLTDIQAQVAAMSSGVTVSASQVTPPSSDPQPGSTAAAPLPSDDAGTEVKAGSSTGGTFAATDRLLAGQDQVSSAGGIDSQIASGSETPASIGGVDAKDAGSATTPTTSVEETQSATTVSPTEATAQTGSDEATQSETSTSGQPVGRTPVGNGG